MKIIIDKQIKDQNKRVAEETAAWIRSNPGKQVCLAAGGTPLGVYTELVAMQVRGEVDLKSIYYVGLDEWVGMGYETRGSCMQLMRDYLYDPAGIPADHMCVWDGLCEDPQKEVEKINAFINAHDHIDFTLLGIGMNGHIGFNEPGTGLPEGGIIVNLSDTTKTVSVKYFDAPLPVSLGVGVGAGSLKKAGKLLLMANEARKADIVSAVVNGPITDDVPASTIKDHADITLFLDEAAAASCDRADRSGAGV